MRCGKCQGCVVTNHGQASCVNCGWFPGCPVRVRGEDGEDLSEVCPKCHLRQKAMDRSLCRPCLDRVREWEKVRRTRNRAARIPHAQVGD
jgi:hypothetical protein